MDLTSLTSSARAHGMGARLHLRPAVGLRSPGVECVLVKPATLAALARLDVESYTLARVLASEGFPGPASQAAAGHVAIGQALVTRARERGASLLSLVTRSKYPAANGLYGRQRGRVCGSFLDPYEWHAEAARAILGVVAEGDISGGADSWLHPSGMGSRLWTVLSRWHTGGLAWIGPSPYFATRDLVLLRSERDPGKRAAALRALRSELGAADADSGAAGALAGAALVATGVLA